MSESIDHHDIARSLDGDGHAYARLVARYQTQIARRMRKFSRDPAVIQELVQDVFVEAYYSLSRFKAEGPFEAWLDRIAVRVGYRYWKQRDRARMALAEPIDVHELAQRQPAALDASQAATVVHALLDRLPPRDRLVLLLLYVEGKNVAETAKLVGWSKTMVHVQTFRAKKKLQRLLERLGIRHIDQVAELTESRGQKTDSTSTTNPRNQTWTA